MADFEEGDQVEKGQILYQIDPSSIDSELSSANDSVSRAENSYNSAKEDYSEVQSEWSGNTYKATETGYIKNLYVEAGDKINNGSQTADIYSDAMMKLRLPSLREEAAMIQVGDQAIVTLSGTGEQLAGQVTTVSSMDETLAGGRLCLLYTSKFSKREEELPFDQHMLLSLIAPRLLYTSARTRDSWADPEGQFQSLLEVSSVYELYGKEMCIRDRYNGDEHTIVVEKDGGYIGVKSLNSLSMVSCGPTARREFVSCGRKNIWVVKVQTRNCLLYTSRCV